MAEEENNINISQTIHNEEAAINNIKNDKNDSESYNSSNLLERESLVIEDTALKENKKSQERTSTRRKTLSFSEDTADLKHAVIVNKNVNAKDTDASKSTTNVEYDDSRVPYDRGWAWVIDFSCFLLFFVYLSHDHWHSVLLMDYLEEFSIPITVVTIMMSLGTAFYCIATQISSNVLVIRFSIRVVAICAAILNVAATLLFAGVPNIATFFIVNFIKYTAKGVTLIATLTLVGYYFRRRRGLATTLGLLGVGSSYMCAPPLIRYLRDEYGFQGCFLILAGLEMHAIFAALLLRPISSYRRRKVHQEMSSSEKVENKHLIAITLVDQSGPARRVPVAEFLEKIPTPPTRIAKTSIAEDDELDFNTTEEVSTPLIREDMNKLNCNSEPLDRISGLKEANSKSDIVTDKATVTDNANFDEDVNIDNGKGDISKSVQNGSKSKSPSDKSKQVAVNNTGSVPRDNMEYAEETPHIIKVPNEDMVSKAGDQLNAVTSDFSLNASNGKANTPSGEDASQIDMMVKPRSYSTDSYQTELYVPKASRASNWSLVTTSTMGSILNIAHVIGTQAAAEPATSNTRFWVKDLIDISLLKNYLAMMISLNYILINMGAFSVVYLPSYANRVGVSSQNAAILLTIVGCMDMVGRLVFGFVADLKILRPHLIIAAIAAAIGIVTQFMPLFTNFESLVLFAVAHGLFAGVGMNLTTVVIVDILGIEHLGKMLPMCSMFNSFSFFIQHPIQGALIEATGNFTTTYHYVGACFLLDTCLLLAEPLLRKLQMRRQDMKRNLVAA